MNNVIDITKCDVCGTCGDSFDFQQKVDTPVFGGQLQNLLDPKLNGPMRMELCINFTMLTTDMNQ